MNRALPILAIIAAILSLACSRNAALTPDDFTETVYEPAYASGFRIIRSPGTESTVLEINHPWQGSDSVTKRIFIARNGETAPASMQSVVAPASRVVCMSTSQIGLLDAFGASESVVGVSGADFVSNPGVKARNIADIGFDGAIDYERLLSARPDIVLLYGVNGPASMEEKLNELGIPHIYIADYLEQSPLGRAEWMVALGELIDRRNDAETAFTRIPQAYDSIKNSLTVETKPAVMLNAPYADTWFMPPVSSYMVRLISDAGGNYIYPQNNSGHTEPVDMEVAASLLARADVWLSPGSAETLGQAQAAVPKLRFDCPVFNCRRDFWESGAAHPDAVLSDMVKMLHNPEDSSLTYFYRLK